MKQKKLMLLGVSYYLMPAIEAAYRLGTYVMEEVGDGTSG